MIMGRVKLVTNELKLKLLFIVTLGKVAVEDEGN